MSRVATICKQSTQRGNALVLELLLKTWSGEDAPDLYQLADLAHISPRQAERDLQKLIDDGIAERVPDVIKGRGHVTRFRLQESPPHVSDKTSSDVADFITEEISATYPSGIPESAPYLTDLSDSKCVTSDEEGARKCVTSASPPIPPYKDLRTSTETEKQGGATAPNTPQAEFTVLRYLQHLATTAAFNHIDPQVEASKIEIWHARPPNEKRKITRRFIENWCNRIERPLEGNDHAVTSNHRSGTRPGREKLTDHARRTAEYFGLGRTPQGSG